MKTKIWYLLFLLAFVACKSDGNGSSTFYFNTYNGEIGPINNVNTTMPNVTVKAYNSVQAWFDGQTPLLTFTTDSKGEYASNDIVPVGTVFYAESGLYNDWPGFFTTELYSGEGNTSGSAFLYLSHLQNFEAVSGKNFLITDLLVNGVSAFASASACSKDNYIRLTKDAKLTLNEGATLCSGATAIQEFAMVGVGPVKNTSETTINGIIVYQFSIPWTDVENVVYIKKDFTKIMFRQYSSSNEYISVYTLQN
jgi:hypothetical protein